MEPREGHLRVGADVVFEAEGYGVELSGRARDARRGRRTEHADEDGPGTWETSGGLWR